MLDTYMMPHALANRPGPFKYPINHLGYYEPFEDTPDMKSMRSLLRLDDDPHDYYLMCYLNLLRASFPGQWTIEPDFPRYADLPRVVLSGSTGSAGMHVNDGAILTTAKQFPLHLDFNIKWADDRFVQVTDLQTDKVGQISYTQLQDSRGIHLYGNASVLPYSGTVPLVVPWQEGEQLQLTIYPGNFPWDQVDTLIRRSSACQHILAGSDHRLGFFNELDLSMKVAHALIALAELTLPVD